VPKHPIEPNDKKLHFLNLKAAVEREKALQAISSVRQGLVQTFVIQRCFQEKTEEETT